MKSLIVLLAFSTADSKKNNNLLDKSFIQIRRSFKLRTWLYKLKAQI